MKRNTCMPRALKPSYQAALHAAEQQFQAAAKGHAWQHLERAHLIGQAYPYEHSRAHWKMLLFGFKTKNIREIIGQIPRLLPGGVKSFVGKIPEGNTGGVNVPPFKPLALPEDIRELFRNSRNT